MLLSLSIRLLIIILWSAFTFGSEKKFFMAINYYLFILSGAFTDRHNLTDLSTTRTRTHVDLHCERLRTLNPKCPELQIVITSYY